MCPPNCPGVPLSASFGGCYELPQFFVVWGRNFLEWFLPPDHGRCSSRCNPFSNWVSATCRNFFAHWLHWPARAVLVSAWLLRSDDIVLLTCLGRFCEPPSFARDMVTNGPRRKAQLCGSCEIANTASGSGFWLAWVISKPVVTENTIDIIYAE